ncbi:MAG: hypothetical protein K8T25_24275 [Planctomycetia bacterium]|nr:hypothetical protein [Planctomycetia bacterium]
MLQIVCVALGLAALLMGIRAVGNQRIVLSRGKTNRNGEVIPDKVLHGAAAQRAGFACVLIALVLFLVAILLGSLLS